MTLFEQKVREHLPVEERAAYDALPADHWAKRPPVFLTWSGAYRVVPTKALNIGAQFVAAWLGDEQQGLPMTEWHSAHRWGREIQLPPGSWALVEEI